MEDGGAASAGGAFIDEAGATASDPAPAGVAPAVTEAVPESPGGLGLLSFIDREELKDCVVRLPHSAGGGDGPVQFKCHRLVLCAASGYFCEKLLAGGPNEVDLPHLPDDDEVIRQVDVGALFPLVLRYAYSDQRWEVIEADVGPENAMGLFALAAALKMKTLATRAFEIVSAASLSPETVVQLLYTAARLSIGLDGFEDALDSCIEALKHCFADACSSSEALRLFCQLPVDLLVPVLDADDLEVPTEGNVLEVVRNVLGARIPSSGSFEDDTSGGAIWAANFSGEEAERVLDTVRFPHVEHDELLTASTDPVLKQAGAQQRVLEAFSARLDRYEHTNAAAVPSKPPRPSTLGAASKKKLQAVAPKAADDPTKFVDPIGGGWPASALEDHTGSVVASPEEPLLFQRSRGDFDEGGALYWLGTKGRTHAWRNPVGLNLVLAISSGVGFGKLEDIVGRQVVNLRSTNVAGSYFGVDLRDRLLVLKGYCLRNRNATSHVMMSWAFQGSLDGDRWEMLDTRNGESSLRRAGATAYFEVRPPPEAETAPGMDVTSAFRYFRVLQVGPNSSGSENLVLSGIELYGYAVGGTWP